VQEEERHNKKTARKKREKVHKTENLRDAIAIDRSTSATSPLAMAETTTTTTTENTQNAKRKVRKQTLSLSLFQEL
jgi:hypothetical protein